MNKLPRRLWIVCGVLALFVAGVSASMTNLPLYAQSQSVRVNPSSPPLETTQDYNQRIEELRQKLEGQRGQLPRDEYRIGPEDLLEISVFDAPELNCSARVSAGGEISLPLLGVVRAAGLSPRELESVLEELLRRSYMKDPHASVFIRELQSHTVSVMGAVKHPGVFQIRGSKSVLEMLSLAGGLDDDAGETVRIMRGPSLTTKNMPFPNGPDEGQPNAEGSTRSKQAPSSGSMASIASSARAETVDVNLKELLNSDDPRYNVLVYPGDIVTVNRAGIVYVVGAVKKPGGFMLRNSEKISALQALALAEGLTSTSSKSGARIIRTDMSTGQRTEIPIDFGKILASKSTDPMLQPKDIVFIPNSGAKIAFYRGTEAAVSIVSGAIIYRGF
jgi:polysaccharide biosynthesis/export protein